MVKKDAIAFAAGVLFALGLGLGGMTAPARVIGFLDLFGRWDPTLLFVMGAAIAVHLPVSLWAKRQGMLLPAVPCAGDVPAGPLVASRIDRPLILGAAIFGVGWGLAGYCPGPAVVSVAGGRLPAVVFVAAMLVGMAVYRFARRAG
jgi:uncharacterized membrane protein YedE/YeeE